MGVMWYSSIPIYGSVPAALSFVNICFTMPTVLSAISLDLGYLGLDVTCCLGKIEQLSFLVISADMFGQNMISRARRRHF